MRLPPPSSGSTAQVTRVSCSESLPSHRQVWLNDSPATTDSTVPTTTLPSPKSSRYGEPTGPSGEASVNQRATRSGSVNMSQASGGGTCDSTDSSIGGGATTSVIGPVASRPSPALYASARDQRLAEALPEHVDGGLAVECAALVVDRSQHIVGGHRIQAQVVAGWRERRQEGTALLP